MPLSLGGLGPAFWESWANSLAMIRQRHPDVAVQLVHQLERHPDIPCLQTAADAAKVPPWSSWLCATVMGGTLARSEPEPLQPDEFEPGCRGRWQHEAASKVEVQFRYENLFQPVGQRVENIGLFPGKCRRLIGILHLPAVPRHPLGAALIPSPPLSSSSSSLNPFRAQLPVWPSG